MMDFLKQEIMAAILTIKHREKIVAALVEKGIAFVEITPGNFDIRCEDDDQKREVLSVIDKIFKEECNDRASKSER